jgi:hypothetical protein
VLIFPLVTYKRALWTYLIPLCSESADFTRILVEDGVRTSELVEGAWDRVRTRCGADFVHMPYLPDTTDLYRLALKEAFRSALGTVTARLRGRNIFYAASRN